MSELISEFKKFQASERDNPDSGGDEISQFLRRLGAEGRLKTYSEEEWAELGKSQGFDDEQTAELVEQAAAWLEKQEIHPQDKSDWPATISSESDVFAQSNPESEEDEEDEDEEGCEGCIDDCDCEDGDEECDCESCKECEKAHEDDEEEFDYCVCCCDCTEPEEEA